MIYNVAVDQDTDANVPFLVLDTDALVVDLTPYDDLLFYVTVAFDEEVDPLYSLGDATIELISGGSTGRVIVHTSAENNASPQIAWYRLDGIEDDKRTRLVSGAYVVLRT